MNERVKELRKTLKLNQEEFGAKLGLSGGGVSKLENGTRNITERTIKSICREFNVEYSWLKYGDGEIFRKDNNLSAVIDNLLAGENETAKAVFKAFAELDDKEWQTIHKLITSINQSIKKEP